MKIKLYEFKNCSTCRKAIKFLDAHKIVYDKLPIVERPPSLSELKTMLNYLKEGGGTFKNLFNTSGVQYRELKISDKLKAGMAEKEALELLSQNGKLIKRPFLLTEKSGIVGFNEAQWKKKIMS